jgi:hypothetical protein
MTNLKIAQQRLYNQGIARARFETPDEVVKWFGAVQAQEYALAKWALGLRMQQATDEAIEQAFTEGAILRTHVMRPTWHFVTPADIRWIQALTAPRVNVVNGHMYRQLELDETLFLRSNEAIVKTLEGGKQLTRSELGLALAQAGIVATGIRLGYIIHRAELEAIVCSGARRGKQFTYALVAERAPQAKTLPRDEALAELTRRYFMSHGPALVQDFVWWSGLTVAEAKAGLEMVKQEFIQEVIESQTYWFSPAIATAPLISPTAYLLPAYDEYTVAYKDRSAVLEPALVEPKKMEILNPAIVIDGRVVGTWKRSLEKETVTLRPKLFSPLGPAETQALEAAAQRYGTFLGVTVKLNDE